ncbi:carbon-nitrogen hydrolase family protein [Pseudomonas sp. P5_109]|jgi:(R)-amidase|uniref:carbon-nitrogen hydrolase family protein n=1 Tax=Pseudomonas sp. P5_109 TaxID=3043441 RepID=UPI002A36449D|nr:carbon-nitrogen hydrolase family protein [Pseudomonas sp. P5_109]WPN27707.1 carbon-nitrogen hydrolase family protein [Pseudomonas sp. P5_109]
MKLELVQLAGRDGDTAYNLRRTLDAIAQCAPDTDIVVFPEAQITGFLNYQNIAEQALSLDNPSVQAILQAAHERNVAVVVGLIENDGGNFYNTTLFITPEGIQLSYRKTHLWVSEPGLVLPGNRYGTVEWRGVRIGLLICYDTEFPETARAVAALGAELILVTDGNMEPYGHVHRTSVTARAQENQVFAVVVNRVGPGDDDTVFAGGSAVIDPFGHVLLESGRQESRHVIELDMSQLADARAVYDYRKDQRFQLAGERIEHADGRRELLIP